MNRSQLKLSVGFVIFNPESDFYSRLKLLNDASIPFYIFDNSTINSNLIKNLEGLEHCKYISSGVNLGLGVGVSEITETAYGDGCDGLLFFDQDTIFKLSTIDFIFKYFINNYNDYKDIYSVIGFYGEGSGISNFSEVDFVINSGSMFFLENIKLIGWHNKSYFVDGVDYEICLRSHMNNFKIGKFINTPYFDHLTGQPDKVFLFFGRCIIIRKYSFDRIRDSIHAYLGLIWTSLSNFYFYYTFILIRSFIIYIFGQILARLILTSE